MTRHSTPFILAGMLWVGCWPALAQDPPEDDNTPGRAVARLSLLNGDVSVRRGDSGDWVAGVPNAPLLVEDRISTGPGARAEVQFDSFHRLRLASDTEVRLPELEWGRFTIQVARGTVTFSAFQGGDAQAEISTPAASVRPLNWGTYRVTVHSDGSADITVRSGEAEIYTPRGSQRLRPGKTMTVRLGEGNEPQFLTQASIPRDAWDAFNEERDRELRSAKSYKYVSRSVYGAEDLDRHGEWVYAEPYGWVWRPYSAPGWVPYRHGRWTWLDWYGWSWISYDPWGWAPYHYGRWFWWNNNWCWFPGAVGRVHWWRPGLVAWFGWGGGGFNVGVGFGWGRIGWVPLAPFEPYYRWWGPGWYNHWRNPRVINNTYITNNINITNVYRNARVRNGVTVNDHADFSRGLAGRGYREADGQLTRAELARGPVPVSPGRDSLRWSERAAPDNLASGRASGVPDRFISSRALPAVDRVPFDQQRRGVEQYARGITETAKDSRATVTNAEGGRSFTGSTWRTDSSGRGVELRGGAQQSGWRTVDGSANASGGRGSTTAQPRSEAARSQEEPRGFGDPRGSGRSLAEEGGRGSRSADAGVSSSAPPENGRGSWRSFGDPIRGGQGDTGLIDRTRSDSSSRIESSRSGIEDASDRTSGRSSDRSHGRSASPARSETPREFESGSRTNWSTGGRGGSSSEGSSGAVRGAPPAGTQSTPSTGGRGDANSGGGARGTGSGGGRSEAGRGRQDSASYYGPAGSGSTARGWSTAGSVPGSFASGANPFPSSASRGSWSTGGSDIRASSAPSRSGGGYEPRSSGGISRSSGSFSTGGPSFGSYGSGSSGFGGYSRGSSPGSGMSRGGSFGGSSAGVAPSPGGRSGGGSGAARGGGFSGGGGGASSAGARGGGRR